MGWELFLSTKKQRKLKILYLLEKRSCSLAELAAETDCNKETVRRYLKELIAEQNLIFSGKKNIQWENQEVYAQTYYDLYHKDPLFAYFLTVLFQQPVQDTASFIYYRRTQAKLEPLGIRLRRQGQLDCDYYVTDLLRQLYLRDFPQKETLLREQPPEYRATAAVGAAFEAEAEKLCFLADQHFHADFYKKPTEPEYVYRFFYSTYLQPLTAALRIIRARVSLKLLTSFYYGEESVCFLSPRMTERLRLFGKKLAHSSSLLAGVPEEELLFFVSCWLRPVLRAGSAKPLRIVLYFSAACHPGTKEIAYLQQIVANYEITIQALYDPERLCSLAADLLIVCPATAVLESPLPRKSFHRYSRAEYEKIIWTHYEKTLAEKG